jgi:hypothetical protein
VAMGEPMVGAPPRGSARIIKSKSKAAGEDARATPQKEKANLIFSDWPLLMPATAGVYPELAEGLPHTWRVQYHRPCGA